MKSVLTPYDFQMINNWIQQKQQVGLSQFARAIQSLGNEYCCEWIGNVFHIYRKGDKANGMQFIIGNGYNEIRNVLIDDMVEFEARLKWLEDNFVPADDLQAAIATNSLAIAELAQHNHDEVYSKVGHTHEPISAGLPEHTHEAMDKNTEAIHVILGQWLYTKALIDQMHTEMYNTIDGRSRSSWEIIDVVQSKIREIFNWIETLMSLEFYSKEEVNTICAEIMATMEDIAYVFNTEITTLQNDLDDANLALTVELNNVAVSTEQAINQLANETYRKWEIDQMMPLKIVKINWGPEQILIECSHPISMLQQFTVLVEVTYVPPDMAGVYRNAPLYFTHVGNGTIQVATSVDFTTYWAVTPYENDMHHFVIACARRPNESADIWKLTQFDFIELTT